jgi:hypothetical protein
VLFPTKVEEDERVAELRFGRDGPNGQAGEQAKAQGAAPCLCLPAIIFGG